MDLATLLPRLVRRWWVVVGAAVLVAAAAGFASSTRPETHERTVQFVLRPNSNFSTGDVPAAIEVLKADGPLLQTVLGVVGSDEILRRGLAASGLPPGAGYTLASTARPGSNLIDATVSGPSEAGVERLSDGIVGAASDYVDSSYPSYALDRLGVVAGEASGPGLMQLLVVALLVGGALGVVLVVAEPRVAPGLRAALDQLRPPPPPEPVPCRATTAKGAPCRNMALDERGLCEFHLNRLRAARASNGHAPAMPRERATVSGVPGTAAGEKTVLLYNGARKPHAPPRRGRSRSAAPDEAAG